uniref:Histidine--tRNA ligase n=1 Tax=Geoglobus ahangari TaxID=113653 RepID=A0A7C4S4U4_9EURY
MKIERPRGTRDFLPDEMERRRHVEKIMREMAELFGYREVQTPTFEHLELFTIKSGESIIEEIYAFKDKSGRDLALRPELTAPVMRLFVNECSVMPRPLRFYYFANCFRYERPQRGRYREFWQFGVELIGSDRPESDAEVITLSYKILDKLGINFDLHIGHVGLLREVFKQLNEKEKALRLVDKKDWEGLEKLLRKENKTELMDIVLALSETSSIDEAREIYPNFDYDYVEKVTEILDELNLKYRVDFGIARGLDYYTGIVFEIYSEGLGAQKQICGGGSYRLSHLFGGSDVPATGFAIGFDRVMEVCHVGFERKKRVVVINVGDYARALKLADYLRESGVPAIVDVMGRSVKKQMSFADSVNADFALFAGEEINEGYVTVKNLRTGTQEKIGIKDLTDYLLSDTS